MRRQARRVLGERYLLDFYFLILIEEIMEGQMSKVFLAGWFVTGTITWLLTTYYAFLNWGILGGLVALFLPPVDIIFMFMLGTWPIGLFAFVLLGLFVATSKD